MSPAFSRREVRLSWATDAEDRGRHIDFNLHIGDCQPMGVQVKGLRSISRGGPSQDEYAAFDLANEERPDGKGSLFGGHAITAYERLDGGWTHFKSQELRDMVLAHYGMATCDDLFAWLQETAKPMNGFFPKRPIRRYKFNNGSNDYYVWWPMSELTDHEIFQTTLRGNAAG
jgi:hypothetical protein